MANVPNVYVGRALRKDIPSEAILLSRSEASEMHWRTIKSWNNHSDVWPFRYGIGFLAGLNAISTLNLTNIQRRMLELKNFARFTMGLPTAIVPAVVSSLFHVKYVATPILLQDECPLCIQMRSAAIQVGTGVFYPLILGPIAGFYYASSYGTYNVPPLRREYLKELFQLWLSMTRRLNMRLPFAILGNGIAAAALTYFEAKSFYNVQRLVLEREEEFRNKIYANKKVE